MTVGTLIGHKSLATGAAALVLASHTLLPAGEVSVTHPTDSEIRQGYLGSVFARLPDHAYSSWMVSLERHGDWYGVSHVEDRGVEMLWLASTQPTDANDPQPVFRVADVLVLPKGYKGDGLVVTGCRGGTQRPAVVALTEPETRKVHRAWTIDLATARLIELFPAADTCSPLHIREVD
jgi:hypothetical protein